MEGGEWGRVPSLPHLTVFPICKPKVIVHTFKFHANCKMRSLDRLNISGVAVWKERNGIGSESYVQSLSTLTDPICQPKVIVHTFKFHANCKMRSLDRLDMPGGRGVEGGEWDRV